MSVIIGDEGGIAIDAESTYGTAGAGKIWQHPISADMVPVKPLIKPNILGVAPRRKLYGVGHSAGEIAVAMDESRAVTGDLFAHFGNLTTNDYLIGSGAAADVDSLTVWSDLGGYLMQYTGFVGNLLRKTIQADQEVMLSFNGLAREGTKETTVTITAPDETDILMESDLTGSILVGGANMCILGMTVEVNWETVAADRHCIGSSNPKQFRRVGVPLITGSLDLELSGDTGADSIAELAKFLASNAIGDVVVDNTSISGAWMTGDFPTLSPGITAFTLNFEANTWIETTTA